MAPGYLLKATSANAMNEAQAYARNNLRLRNIDEIDSSLQVEFSNLASRQKLEVL